MSIISIPNSIDYLMLNGAVLAINISGGKDSQAMAIALLKEYKHRGWAGQIVAIHANLGRADWEETLPFSRLIAAQSGITLEVVAAEGDLVDRMEQRLIKLDGTGKPFWPSPAARYCTSDLKRSPINKALRRYPLIISAAGIRAEESADRAKLQPLSIRKNITSSLLQDLPLEEAIQVHFDFSQQGEDRRLALDWFPIFDWKVEEVWNGCGTNSKELENRRSIYNTGNKEQALDGWPCHPCYVRGMDRLGCCLCIFNNESELKIAKKEVPVLFNKYVEMQDRSGFLFKKNLDLNNI